MSTTLAEPTPAMQAGAEQLLASPERWTQARRKSDGRPFSIVQGRTGVYYTTPDACTCPGFARRGVCSHSLAATMREAQQASRRAPCELPIVTTTRSRYDDLFPSD